MKPTVFDEYNLVQEDATKSRIMAIDDYGFQINGNHLRGSVIVFPTFSLLWKVNHLVKITPESLVPILLPKRPRIEFLVIGSGPSHGVIKNINPEIYDFFSRRGVAVEVMSTDQAVATFNVLAQEDRPVAAALLSRKPTTPKMASAYTRGGRGFDPEMYKLRSAARAGAAEEAAALLAGNTSESDGPPGVVAPGRGGKPLVEEGGLFGGGTFGADGGDSIREWLGMESSDPRASGVHQDGESATNLDGLVKKGGSGGGDGHDAFTDSRGRVRGADTPSRKRKRMALKGSPPRFYANRGSGGYKKPQEEDGQDWEKKG